MAQRISRAKQTIKAGGMQFELPPPDQRAERLRAVRHVLYLIFNEGHTTTTGPDLQRVEFAAEAIRLARMLHRLLPADGETTGLLALMLLTHARRRARAGPGAVLIPLADQDRSLWERQEIEQGLGLLEHALTTAAIGPYQVQAAIAAVHSEAPSRHAQGVRNVNHSDHTTGVRFYPSAPGLRWRQASSPAGSHGAHRVLAGKCHTKQAPDLRARLTARRGAMGRAGQGLIVGGDHHGTPRSAPSWASSCCLRSTPPA